MIDAVISSAAALALFGILAVAFLITPFSNVLNVVTVPLGYEYSSCPYCPEFGITKIEYVACEQCGVEHGRGFSGTAAYRDGEKHPFCGADCLQAWKQERRES